MEKNIQDIINEMTEALAQRDKIINDMKSMYEFNLNKYGHGIAAGISPEPKQISNALSLFGDEETISNIVQGYQHANEGVNAEFKAKDVKLDHLSASDEWTKAGESFLKASAHFNAAGKALALSVKNSFNAAANHSVSVVKDNYASVSGQANKAVESIFSSAVKAADKSNEMFKSAKNSIASFYAAIKEKAANLVSHVNGKVDHAKNSANAMSQNIDARVSANLAKIESRIDRGISMAEEIKLSISGKVETVKLNAIAVGKTAEIIAEPLTRAMSSAGSEVLDFIKESAKKIADKSAGVAAIYVAQKEIAMNESSKTKSNKM